jgi:hypothetical protein
MQRLSGWHLAWVAGSALFVASSCAAHASTLDLGGATFSFASGAFYGSAAAQNNVVNSPGSPATGSMLVDPTGPNIGPSTPWLVGGVPTTSLTSYTVNWYYAGSESGYNITFNAPGLSGGDGPYTEHDSNNSCVSGCGAHGTTTPIFMGATQNSLSFALSWPSGSASDGTPSANLIYAYLQPDETGTSFTLTTAPTDWFVFALNDSGSPDSDYDDFVGFAQIVDSPGQGPGETPIPGSLPLIATGMLGGMLMLKRRPRGARSQEVI